MLVGKDKGTGMMEIGLVLPVGGIPLREQPVGPGKVQASPQFLKALQAKLKERAFGFTGRGAAAAGGLAAEELGCDLATQDDSQPGGQGHGDQQTTDVVEVGNLTALPLPAIGLEIAESRLNEETLAIAGDEYPVRGASH